MDTIIIALTISLGLCFSVVTGCLGALWGLNRGEKIFNKYSEKRDELFDELLNRLKSVRKMATNMNKFINEKGLYEDYKKYKDK